MEQYHLVSVLVVGEVVQVAGDGVVASLHRLQVVTSGELLVHPRGGCRWWLKVHFYVLFLDIPAAAGHHIA